MTEEAQFEEIWDADQRSVIEAKPDKRLLVSAGPGTGKTAVACARLAYLIENDAISESNVWMISFTRTAVAEIKARLYSYVGEATFSIKVATVDSHAWSIHWGHDANAKLTDGYENNIERVIDLLTEDEEVAETLSMVEHLVIDEAQDLVGRRADLVNLLIQRLNLECGITVFADEAQAIYGFSEDDDITRDWKRQSLINSIRDSDLAFKELQLKSIHRTASAGLKYIFGDVREEVLNSKRPLNEFYKSVRASVFQHADKNSLKTTELGIETIPANSLVLMRSRAEALRHSQFCERPHGLRLSGFGAHLPAWVAICLHDFNSTAANREQFVNLWNERIELVASPEYGALEAWGRLLRLAANRDGSVNIGELRRRLSNPKPPVEIAVPEFGLPGPIIGTIHASKGREADHVTLLVPNGTEFGDQDLEAEETRILFVGATRAKKRLHVGNSSRYNGSNLDSGRAYKLGQKYSCKAMVEIGRDVDFTPSGISGKSYTSEEEFLAAQSWLANSSALMTGLQLEQDKDFDWLHRLFDPVTDVTLAFASKAFLNDIWAVAKIMGKRDGTRLKPNFTIQHVRSLGSRTVVVDSNDPILETIHAPVARAGFFLSPMVGAFTNVYFSKY